MLFTTSTLSLVLALAPTTLFAAPTRTTELIDSIANIFPRQNIPAGILSQLAQTNSLCDLSNIVLPIAPTPLAPITPGLTLRHIAIGRGTQNYTCTSSSALDTPKPTGAIATLFNATCDAARLPTNVLADITKLALNYAIPSATGAQQRVSGHHEFTAAGVPLFNLVTPNADLGYVLAKPDAVKSSAPVGAAAGANGLGSVAWLKLSAVEGDYKEVYRVHTAGGVAPKNCDGVDGGFTVEYSAQYWFYA
ncbi:hypothetical protein IAQ61_005063 [Plenodomus lingam]|uniref:Malate dehydrogenase n=1 Tax=Leptosphaeria maculans (strain JN3 / isolate v23.1.3 / race Av1-4-5-6-7-8) TaxID=985895 RepID=E5A7U1_LEPMJ|nr:predicted protein [Plenodomus lingam JN3]KAH9872228.1 hypothetical protein IAQ61_005063 [Plenodomus lingam]CBX99686.1 predicted protein [Plenodomus lingam JN3]